MSELADRIARDALDAVQLSVREAAELALERAKALAPKGASPEDPHPGRLAESARIDYSTNRRSATISFNTPYAAKQHEDRHLKHPHGGEALYLGKAMLEVTKAMDDILAHNVRAQVRER